MTVHVRAATTADLTLIVERNAAVRDQHVSAWPEIFVPATDAPSAISDFFAMATLSSARSCGRNHDDDRWRRRRQPDRHPIQDF